MASEPNILKSVKKVCNVAETDTSFDTDLILFTNAQLSVLPQLGVRDQPFVVDDGSEEWGDFLFEGSDEAEMVKAYVGVAVRLVFDPPASASVKEALENYKNELEWRINVAVDPGKEED